jgi:hypothetical protein
MITIKAIQRNLIFGCPLVSCAAIVFVVTTKKNFLAFRVSPDLKNDIQGIANSEARSISQVCELLLSEGVQAYKKEGPKFMQRSVARQKSRGKEGGDRAS